MIERFGNGLFEEMMFFSVLISLLPLKNRGGMTSEMPLLGLHTQVRPRYSRGRLVRFTQYIVSS